MKHLLKASALALVLSPAAIADVGPDYVCQDQILTSLPAPKGTIDYWTNVATSWTNSRSGDLEIFLRGPGLVDVSVEVSGDKTQQVWLSSIEDNFQGHGLYLTFKPSECSTSDDKLTYCFRDREETETEILAAGLNEYGQKKRYRALPMQAKSVQAVLTDKQTLVSFINRSGKRITVGLACDSKEWYAHIPFDEMPRLDM